MGQQRLFSVRQLVILLMLFGLVQVGWGDLSENFDGWSDGSYSTTSSYDHTGVGQWETYNSMCHSINARSGNCVRFNDDSGSNEYLLFKGLDGNGKDGGIGTISFYYRHWNGDGSNVEIKVEYSTNSGSNWTQIGSNTSVTSTTYTQFSETPNVDSDNILIRVNAVQDAERLCIDDFSITDYSAGTVNNPTSFAIEYVTSDKISLTWTAPSGTYDDVLVFGRNGSAVDHSPSGAGSGYSDANAAWGSAGSYDNSKLLYSGTGTSLTVTGLSDGTTYYFKAYAYYGSDWSSGTSDINDVAEVQEVSSLAASTDNAQTELTWTNYSGTVSTWWDQVIILAKSGSAVDATPTGNPSGYTANAAFGSGTQVGTGNYVVYKGTGTSQTVTSLTNGTTYHFEAFVYYLDSGSGHDYSDGITANCTPAVTPDPNDVIINEYDGDATNEWVELLVVVNGGVDLRNWLITDEEPSSMGSIGEGVISFADNSALSAIPQGTYIVIIDGSGTDDTDHSDKTMTLYTGNSLLSETNSFALSNTGDNITLWYDDNGTYDASNSKGIDHISYEGDVSPPSGVTWTYGSGIADEDAYFSDGASFNNDDASDWTVSSTHTQGAVNTDQNDSSLPVELNYFEGVSRDGMVVLSWVTESEIDNLGFILYRQTRGQSYELLDHFRTNRQLQGQGSVTHRTQYNYTDEKVRVGQTYEYLLVDVDYHGLETRHDPVSVTVRPRGITMKSAYPNPFNPLTKFTVIVGDPQHLSINVYDVTGRLVKTLTNERVPAGEHIIAWDGTNSSNQTAASGIYFVRLVVNGTTHFQKLLLAR